MEHTFVLNGVEKDNHSLVIFQKDNNLDGRDNLEELPESPAVYVLCGRVNGLPVNARYVGETENLQMAIRKHFDVSEEQPSDCLKQFMQSIKIKCLVYHLMQGSTKADRLKKKIDYENQYKPDCSEALNQVH